MRDRVYYLNKTMFTVGNRIGEEGIKALTLAVGYQTSLSQFHSAVKPGCMGLMRLAVHVSLLALFIFFVWR